MERSECAGPSAIAPEGCVYVMLAPGEVYLDETREDSRGAYNRPGNYMSRRMSMTAQYVRCLCVCAAKRHKSGLSDLILWADTARWVRSISLYMGKLTPLGEATKVYSTTVLKSNGCQVRFIWETDDSYKLYSVLTAIENEHLKLPSTYWDECVKKNIKANITEKTKISSVWLVKRKFRK